jgi:septal ring factor EnvC (AmiA/AmiB activator)
MKGMILPEIRRGGVLVLLIGLNAGMVFGKQDDDQGSLHVKYRKMVEDAETYEKYKVIATQQLNGFWGEVEDSLVSYRKEIADVKTAIANINATLEAVNDSLAVVNEQLQASEEVNSEISFLGMSLNKSFYNMMVWGIVGGLLVLLGIMYVSFKNSHSITIRAKRDLVQVTEELEELRQRSNEKQVKLKRELQTAVNQLEEVRRKAPAGR